MQHYFILNPAAGKRDQTKTLRRVIQETCETRNLPYTIAVSQAPGDCRRLAREAARTGEEVRLYACGGDGTLNEVASGAAGFPNAAVTHFAGGSGNDFVKLFTDPSAFRDLDKLLDCRETRFDLIRCNADYALNVCSVGLDARIGTDMVHYKHLPLVTGSGAYLLSALVNVIRGVSEHYRVELEGEVLDGPQTLVLAASGRYYGGGFYPVPDADPRDGMLDVLLVRPVSRLQVLTVIGKYKAGLYRQYPELIRHVRARRLTIRCDGTVPVNLDGECRMARQVEIEVIPQALRFFYPAEVQVKLPERVGEEELAAK